LGWVWDMRTRRLKAEGCGAVYHCISRIVGADYLLEGDREREVLRNQIWKVADFCGVEVLTYCVMSNHFHVLVRVPDRGLLSKVPDSELLRRAKRIYGPERAGFFEQGLAGAEPDARKLFREQLVSRMCDVSQYMKELKQRFSIWYNKAHLRVGTLWAERFKSVLVEDEPMALSTVAAYIDLNPVRAGIVSDPAEYRFCGYAEAMGGFGPAREGISRLMGYGEVWGAAVARYRVAVFGKGQDGDADRPGRSVDGETAARVMNEGGKVRLDEALRCRVRYFSDGAVLGSREFVEGFFDAARAKVGVRGWKGPRELVGSDWGGLSCARGLRRRVFG
jgi:putative transposase